MRKYNFKTLFALSLCLSLGLCLLGTTSCDDKDSVNESVVPANVQAVDLSQYSSGTTVMMQAFFWDVPAGGVWWKFIGNETAEWQAAGIDQVWLPPFSKAASGGLSMGYDPADYFDWGEYNQHGSVDTRFGSKQDLLDLVKNIHDHGMKVIADIVINHNDGGADELNSSTGETHPTLFDPASKTNMSGRFNRDWSDFRPYDPNALFYPYTNLDLTLPAVQYQLWGSDSSVALTYKNVLGIDGWRFDYVKGYSPAIIAQWNDATGNLFSVGENWDGDANVLNKWVTASGSKAFDFAAFYNCEKAFDSQRDLNYLKQPSLLQVNPSMAVTFMGNHDTEDRDNTAADGTIATQFKPLAYAYMLTHPGTPTIFYSDYEKKLSKTELNNLIKINKTIANGALTILRVTNYEYVARREGSATNPGLIVYMNISSSPKSYTVKTNWAEGSYLYDYSGNTTLTSSQAWPVVGANGIATITVQPNSYSIWSIGAVK